MNGENLMNDPIDAAQCRTDLAVTQKYRDDIPGVVDALVSSCNKGNCFDHVGPEPIPSREAIIGIIESIRRILYPGYFISKKIDSMNVRYYFGQEVTGLFETLSEQITLAIRHDCIRHNLSCSHCEERGQQIALDFLKKTADLRARLAKDIRAAYEGDPAAKGLDEVIFSYPGLYAVTVYRMAHLFHQWEVPMMPRIMTEYAHSLTGIDIHPGAEIGESFFIDHGTGVVIGETAIIGNRVRLYQGVTLGAISLKREELESLRNQKRHPTVEDDVIIYANATVLGGKTIIGARSVIGGNVWITESVPPDMEVFLKNPELDYKKRSRRSRA